MKVSEIQKNDLSDFLRLDEEDESLEIILSAAKSYVCAYTGMTEPELDLHEDITHAVMVLCQDMHDNRSMYVDKTNVNKVVECILGMHCRNLL